MPSRSRVAMIRTAISPRLAIRTLLKVFPGTGTSHPEDTVAGRLERGAGGHRQREAEDAAGAGRVDDPVVPQPGSRVVRVALVLVLLATSASSLPTVASTLAAWSPPMTEMRAFGHIHRNRGE